MSRTAPTRRDDARLPRRGAGRLSVGALAALLALFATGVRAQQQQAQRPEGELESDFRLSVDVPRVVLSVTVLAKDGSFAPGLTKDDFMVIDDGRQQEILEFSADDRPATLGLVIDNSRSMTPQRVQVVQASVAFVSLSNAKDDFFVVHFNEHVRLGLPGNIDFASDLAKVRSALWSLDPDGQTALYDATGYALLHANEGRWNKQVLLMISDGGDTASEIDFDTVLEAARRSPALVYCIGLHDRSDPNSSPGVLRKLAAASGGRAFFPESSAEIISICRRIAEEIRRQYTIVYEPTDPGNQGRYRKIQVRLQGRENRKLMVRTREGYYEPDVSESSEERADAR